MSPGEVPQGRQAAGERAGGAEPPGRREGGDRARLGAAAPVHPDVGSNSELDRIFI